MAESEGDSDTEVAELVTELNARCQRSRYWFVCFQCNGLRLGEPTDHYRHRPICAECIDECQACGDPYIIGLTESRHLACHQPTNHASHNPP